MGERMPPHQPALTIAVFSKDEDASLPSVLDGILRNYPETAVLLVVPEQTPFISALAKEKEVAVLRDNGRGKGAAIRAAIAEATSEFLVFVDADGSHRTEDIPDILRPLLAGQADMVIASRLKGGSEEFSGSFNNRVHWLGNWLSAILIWLLWGRRAGQRPADCQNGFRALRTEAAKKLPLQEDGFAIEQEMVIQCYKQGLRIAEHPSFELKRRFGRSHIREIPEFFAYARCLLRNVLG